jgi:uncharacterized protein (DUF2147 family)
VKPIWISSLLFLTLATQGLHNGILGNWKDPTGSVIQIYQCGANVCARLVAIRTDAPTHFDAANADPALRKRSLCGLQIGSGFHFVNPDRAEGGRLYDPESGKTYSGSLTRDGDTLKLRGYIGIALFGRTEVWTQAPDNLTACRP